MFFSRDLKGENAAVDSGTESLQSVLSQKNIHICLWSDGTRDSFGNIVPKFAAGLGDIKAVAKNCDFFKQLVTIQNTPPYFSKAIPLFNLSLT